MLSGTRVQPRRGRHFSRSRLAVVARTRRVSREHKKGVETNDRRHEPGRSRGAVGISLATRDLHQLQRRDGVREGWADGEGGAERRADGEADPRHVRPLRSSRIEIPAEPSSRTRCLADRAHAHRLSSTSDTDAVPRLSRWAAQNAAIRKRVARRRFSLCASEPYREPARPSSLTERVRAIARLRSSSAGRSCTLVRLGFRCERSLKRAQARGAPNTVECRVHGSRERASERYRPGPLPLLRPAQAPPIYDHLM